MSKRIELLAPAADLDCLKAAISAGATSVYLGVGKLNARQYATNFSMEDLKDALYYAHIRNIKIFVALNILFNDDQLNEVYSLIDELYLMGVDGLIIQDFGVLNYTLRQYPDWFISASTQMSIDSLEGVKFLEDIGVKRVVLGRECDIDTVKHIKENTNIEIEVFGHGALCVCVSGQCLLSYHIGERSGNRGTCAQPCRKKYQLINKDTKEELSPLCYLLSMKDLKTINKLEELKKANIDSLKIEGRMKSSDYVYNVVSNYAKALNKDKFDENNLNYTFQRTFTNGHLFKSDVKTMVNIERPNNVGIEIGKVSKVFPNGKVEITLNHPLNQNDFIRIASKNKDIEYKIAMLFDEKDKLVNSILKGKAYIKIQEKPNVNDLVYLTDSFNFNKEIKKLYPCEYHRIPLYFTLIGEVGSNLILKISDSINNIEINSIEVLEQANNVSLDKERIISQLQKLNDTPYTLKKCIINVEDNAYIPIKTLNELRRKGIELLNQKRNEINRQSNISLIEYHNEYIPNNKDYILNAQVLNQEQYDKCKELGIKHIYFQNIVSEAHDEYNLNQNEEILINNYGGLNKFNRDISIANHNLNTYNHTSLHELNKYCKRITLSLEVDANKAIELITNFHNHYNEDINIEYVVYGKTNLMTSKYCPLRVFNQCGKCKTTNYQLKDEYGVFDIYGDDKCYMHLLSSKPSNKIKDIQKLLPYVSYFRLNFTNETSEEVEKIINEFKNHKV